MRTKLVNGKSIPHKIIPTLLSSVIIFIVTFTVFFRTLKGDFLFFDDDWTIFKNPNLGSLNFDNLVSIFRDSTVSSPFYTPLGGLRWCITHTLSGLEPFAYHLGNLLLHAATAVLLFLVVRKILLISLKGIDNTALQWRLNVAAVMATLIWSLHPLRIEPVAWLAAGLHIQSCFFTLLSLLCYLQIVEPGSKYRFWLTISVICYVASLLSMPFPTAAVFPVILVVLDVYPFKRLDSIKAWWKSKRVRSVIFEKLIFLAVAVIVIIANIVLVSYNFRPANHAYVSLTEFGILDRLMQAFYVWAYYLWRPFYPVNLSPLYTTLWKEFNPLSLPFVFSALGIITATSIIFAIRKRYPSLLAAWICYLILLIPALGLNMHPHSTADRYSYAVSMILSVLLAGWMLNVGTVTFRLFCIGITVILIFLGIASNKQISVWHDTPSLMRHILITTSSEPNLPYREFVYHRLANYYLINGRYEESISPLTEAIQMNPKDTTTYFYRGISYYNIGNYKQAIEDFGRAIELNPGYAEPYYTRGVAYITHGDNISGCPDARKACELGNCKLLEAANTRGLCH